MPAIPPYIHRSPFGNNSVLFCPSEKCIILWDVTARASPTGWLSTSWGFQVLVFGCAYRRIADDSCSATTLRERRDEWIACGVIEKLRQIALEAYDRLIGLQLAEVAVDGCITKAPCGGEKAGKSPVDRGKQGIKRSTAVDGRGVPIGSVSAPAKAATIRRFWSLPSRARLLVGGRAT